MSPLWALWALAENGLKGPNAGQAGLKGRSVWALVEVVVAASVGPGTQAILGGVGHAEWLRSHAEWTTRSGSDPTRSGSDPTRSGSDPTRSDSA